VQAQAERAVAEVQPNDLDEQARDIVNKGWSKDQWISGVLERAIGLVARSAEKGRQGFALEPWEAERCRYAVWDDKALSTYYERAELASEHLKRFFPIRNIDVENDEDNINAGGALRLQGMQRPDSISRLKLTSGDVARQVCICFEGDGHDLDAAKAGGSGMYSYEKMFQDASLCHDVSPGVPAIFITSALFTHEDARFPAFQDWSAQFLKTHVLLVERLLQYVAEKETSWIHRQLAAIDAAVAGRQFDFFCWINAVYNGDTVVTKGVAQCAVWMAANEQQHHGEFEQVFEMRKKFYATGPLAFDDAADGLQKSTFEARVLKFSENGMSVVIFAVPRLETHDAQTLAQNKGLACSGLWYPEHVAAYVEAHAGAGMQNFLVPAARRGPGELEFASLHAIRSTTAPTALTIEEFDRTHKDSLSGQFIFALPWLWLNIAFLCILKSMLTYRVAIRAKSTLKAYVAFARRYSTQISSRDTVPNPMKMFEDDSASLFAHACRRRASEVRLDGDLLVFLEQKCGWTNPTAASSPAVFFKLVGACNLITAHTLAKQVQRTPALRVKFDKVKDAFPLGAQVEVDYALECLSRHYYFVQDKGAALDGFVPQAKFDALERRLMVALRAPGGAGAAPAAAPAAAGGGGGGGGGDGGGGGGGDGGGGGGDGGRGCRGGRGGRGGRCGRGGRGGAVGGGNAGGGGGVANYGSEGDDDDASSDEADDEEEDESLAEEEEEEEEESSDEEEEEEVEEVEDRSDADSTQDGTEYKEGARYRVCSTPTAEQLTPEKLGNRLVAVKFDQIDGGQRWYRGRVQGLRTTRGKGQHIFNILFDSDDKIDYAKLTADRHGCDNHWVLLEPR